jgi:hypothetical protein
MSDDRRLLLTVHDDGGKPVLRCASVYDLQAATAVCCRALAQQDCAPEITAAARALFMALTGEAPKTISEMDVRANDPT